jgi:hypothetical protein
MTHQPTVPVRIYDSDKDYLMLIRGNGTPADALNKLITKYRVILDVTKEDLS